MYTAPNIVVLLDYGYVVKHLVNTQIVIIYPLAFAVKWPCFRVPISEVNLCFSLPSINLVFRREYSIKSRGKG